MKKVLFILLILSVLALGFVEKVKLVPVEVINKTGQKVTLTLTEFIQRPEADAPTRYYLPMEVPVDPSGAVFESGFFKEYTIVAGFYSLGVYACGDWQPIQFKLDMTSRYRITLLPCGQGVPEGSIERGFLKISPVTFPPDEDEVYMPFGLKYDYPY